MIDDRPTQPDNQKDRVVLSILMPVRNEGINLRIMLKMLTAVVDVPCEVLIVHDEPDDDSVEIIDRLQTDRTTVRCLHNQLGRGVINAIRTGVNQARGEFILLFAADEVGPVLAIEDMLNLMNQGCDFVSCSRYAHGGRRLGGSIIGGILSRFANRLFRLLSGTRFTDCTTGIKMFRRSVFDQLDLQAKPIGWAVAFEMAIKAQYLGLILGEVPIISIDRLYGGASTFRLSPWCVEYTKWFLWGVWRLHRWNSGSKTVLMCKPAVVCR